MQFVLKTKEIGKIRLTSSTTQAYIKHFKEYYDIFLKWPMDYRLAADILWSVTLQISTNKVKS